jgi:hypothetical protein
LRLALRKILQIKPLKPLHRPTLRTLKSKAPSSIFINHSNRFLDKIAQTTTGAGQEKDQKVVMNQILNEYYMNKGKHPQKLLNELIQLAQD